jgi:Zn-dependent protease
MGRFKVPFRMHGTGWFLLVLCLLIGVTISGLWLGFAVGVAVAVCLLLHEAGHMLAAILLRVPVLEFGLCLFGAYNRRAYASRRRDEMIISFAGPLMNLFLVLPLLHVPVVGGQLALCNLLLGIGNLLPLSSSDGQRILRMMRASRAHGRLIPVENQASIL